MSLATAVRYHLPEQQAAWLGLSTRPLVTPGVDPELHALISRHRPTLERWAGRAGYRLVNVGSAYRLRRVPLDGTLALPAVATPPPRRELVLTLVIAAGLEDHSADSVTLQEISDATRQLVGVSGLRDYDPDRRPHRVALVRAVDRLVGVGVLARHTARDDLLRAWEDEGTGVGAGYVIDRDALVVLVDPYELNLALTGPDAAAEVDARGARILRGLLETQSVAVADLSQDERDYLTGQRTRLVHQAQEMTGGSVEVRADGLTLVLPGEGRYAEASTLRFPGVSTREWVALRLLDDASRSAVELLDRPGFRGVSAAAIAATVQQVYDELRPRLTQELRESPAAVRSAAETQLRGAGLLEVGADGWWVLRPAAARYRAVDLDAAAAAGLDTAPSTVSGQGSAGQPIPADAPSEPTPAAAMTTPPAARPAGPAQDSLFGDVL